MSSAQIAIYLIAIPVERQAPPAASLHAFEPVLHVVNVGKHRRYHQQAQHRRRNQPANHRHRHRAAKARIGRAQAIGGCGPGSGVVGADAMGKVEYFLLFVETTKADFLAFAPAAAQKNINLEILSSLLIPVPPLNELTRIVTRVASLHRLCADLRLAASQSTNPSDRGVGGNAITSQRNANNFYRLT
jgi:hypothetical protein